MAPTDVLNKARALPRLEQLRLIQELVTGLLKAEAVGPGIEPGQEYPVWFPDAAYAAADTLMQSLAKPGQTP